jgi:hypothetical protein
MVKLRDTLLQLMASRRFTDADAGVAALAAASFVAAAAVDPADATAAADDSTTAALAVYSQVGV